jgi:ribonuclease Z
MYGDESKKGMAIEKKHMTFGEAAIMAKEANVKELWLTHYSPSLKDPDEYIDETKKIFNNTKVFKHGGYIDLMFED